VRAAERFARQLGGQHDRQREHRGQPAGRGDLEVAGEFVQHVRGTEASAAERDLLGRALAAALREEVSA
jgi:exonuclease SbcD